MHFKCYYGNNRTNVGDELLDHDSNCVKHKNINYLSLPFRVVIYLVILSVGIFNMIIFFYDFFKWIIICIIVYYIITNYKKL